MRLAAKPVKRQDSRLGKRPLKVLMVIPRYFPYNRRSRYAGLESLHYRSCTFDLLESFGNVALKAMAMGRPVVASCIDGLADIVVDGQTGFLVAPGNWCALGNAIQQLLDDPMSRERMGMIAKERVAEFQARTVVTGIEQVYQEVLYS